MAFATPTPSTHINDHASAHETESACMHASFPSLPNHQTRCFTTEGPLGGGSELIKIATKDWPSREALEMGNRASASKQLLEKCANGYWTKGNNFEREVLTFNTHYQASDNTIGQVPFFGSQRLRWQRWASLSLSLSVWCR